MRKLLNTVYILQEQAYLTLDGENLVCKIDGETKLQYSVRKCRKYSLFQLSGLLSSINGKVC